MQNKLYGHCSPCLGLDVEMHEVEWGKGIPLDNLEARL
ncbi:hypothetical protein BMETH_3081173283925, partial [methanotrophic bacterial endosymbiont of Bathymodiolus sp.]